MQKYSAMVASICTQTATNSFLLKDVYLKTARDNTNNAIASTITIKRFAPSGSLKKKNSVFEQTIAVAPKMAN
jgi:hypothetical protein